MDGPPSTRVNNAKVKRLKDSSNRGRLDSDFVQISRMHASKIVRQVLCRCDLQMTRPDNTEHQGLCMQGAAE